MATAEVMEVVKEAEAVRMPDLFEVINGEIVEVPEMSFNAVEIANMLFELLIPYLATHPIGRARVEQMFHIPTRDDEARLRRPDVAFVSYDRLPKSRKNPRQGNVIEGVIPELTVEVISPSEYARDVQRKSLEYLQAGVKLVWVIFPETCQVYVYTGPTAVRIYGVADTLDGGDVLPGFTVRVAELFPETEDDSATD